MSTLKILKDLVIVTIKAAIIATLLFALTMMLITQAHAADSTVDPVTTAAGPLNNSPGSKTDNSNIGHEGLPQPDITVGETE